MKKTLIVLLILCMRISFSQSICIATKNYPLAFEDTSLDIILQTNIVQDLNRYFTYANTFNDAFRIGRIENNGKVIFYHCNSISKEVFKNLKCESNNGSTNLFVNTILSEFYKSQYIILQNCGISNAFENASIFINLIRTGSITNQPISEQIKFLQKNPRKNHQDLSEQEILSELDKLSEFQFYPVTIL